MPQTNTYESLLAEVVTHPGHHGDIINGYLARPLGPGPFPGVVVIHHRPGWDDWWKEATSRLARHGYVALCPNLYSRAGDGDPLEVADRVKAQGGLPDDQAVGDVEGAGRYLLSLPYTGRRLGLFGGRHSYLAACRSKLFHACVDLWGGLVVMSKEELTPAMPVAPIEYTKDLACPVLGLFGQDDKSPSPTHVTQQEEEMKKYGKVYELHTYPGAGHAFFNYNMPNYRYSAAMDGWSKVFAFLQKHLKK